MIKAKKLNSIFLDELGFEKFNMRNDLNKHMKKHGYKVLIYQAIYSLPVFVFFENPKTTGNLSVYHASDYFCRMV